MKWIYAIVLAPKSSVYHCIVFTYYGSELKERQASEETE